MKDQDVCPVVDQVELEQMIRQRAFELFLERAGSAEAGSPESDWLAGSSAPACRCSAARGCGESDSARAAAAGDGGVTGATALGGRFRFIR